MLNRLTRPTSETYEGLEAVVTAGGLYGINSIALVFMVLVPVGLRSLLSRINPAIIANPAEVMRYWNLAMS
jgi:hypothetical protein